MSLVIVGSIGLDDVKTPAGQVNEALGGSAVYASVAAKNFCPVACVGVVGSDFPQEYRDLLDDAGIDTTGLEVVDGPTFRWAGSYDDLNRADTLKTELGVFAGFDPKLPEPLTEASYILLGNIDPVLQLAVVEQMKAPRLIAMDTMNFWITGKKQELLTVLKKVHLLFINEDEVKMLTGEGNIFAAAQAARELGPELVIIKRGEYGALAVGEDFMFFAPIFPVKDVVDPTGAGDSFAGGFMGHIARQDELSDNTIRNAMIYGSVTASFNIESFSLERLAKITPDMLDDRREAIKNWVSFI